jgi:hypothetical protein
VDTSFLVFHNEQQQEYLGARTSVLGVDRSFDLARDYYVDFHEINPQARAAFIMRSMHRYSGRAFDNRFNTKRAIAAGA